MARLLNTEFIKTNWSPYDKSLPLHSFKKKFTFPTTQFFESILQPLYSLYH